MLVSQSLCLQLCLLFRQVSIALIGFVLLEICAANAISTCQCSPLLWIQELLICFELFIYLTMADNQQNRGSTLLNLSQFLCTIVWELTSLQFILWAQVVSCHKPVTPSCSRTFVRSPLRKMSRQFPGFLANPTPPFKERQLIPGGDKAGAKKKRKKSHDTDAGNNLRVNYLGFWAVSLYTVCLCSPPAFYDSPH